MSHRSAQEIIEDGLRRSCDEILFEQLYQGGAASWVSLAPRADLHVGCASERKPSRASATQVVWHLPLHDDPLTDWSRDRGWGQNVRAVAGHVQQALEQGYRVLITCHLGLNRSGLLVALTLVRLGYPAEQAIATVRRARGPWALSNPQFVKVIQQFAGTPNGPAKKSPCGTTRRGDRGTYPRG